MSATATAPPAPAPAKRVRVRDTEQIAKDLRRQLRNGLGRRAAAGDLDALTELDALKAFVEEVIVEAVGGNPADATMPGLRSEDGGAYSLSEIGRALGYPEESARQSAAYRFRNADKSTAARTGGGQPADRR
jgi:hypothetical protein